MSFINFRSHLNVALNKNEPYQNRIWAFRSCCYGVCSLVRVIDTDELIKFIAKKINAEVEITNNRVLLTSNISGAVNFLVKFRAEMHAHKNKYDNLRRNLKQTKRRFPVQKPFERKVVLEVLETMETK